MEILNQRQLNILEFVKKGGGVSNSEIRENIENKFDKISRITIVRDINKLLEKGLIKKQGQGRGVRYVEAIKNKLLAYFDVENYFKLGPDERKIAFNSFNFDIFKNILNIFTKEELEKLKILNDDYLKRIKKLPPTILKKEFERLTIELSWKSSRIEGNTYSLIDTEILIKEQKEAAGHQKEESIMILNHKAALDYILAQKNDFKKLNLLKIENIHSLIVKDLGISRGIRKKIVGIVGTRYKPPDNQYQIEDAMGKTIKVINTLKNPFTKVLIAILMLSYIQPFEDGNKRTARLLGNAILLADNVCPLSFRSIDEGGYKKARVLFYEQNSLRFFKELFIQQFEFAVKNYFL